MMWVTEGFKVEDMQHYYRSFWRRARFAESCRNVCKARMAVDKVACKATFCSCCLAPRMSVGQFLAQSC